MEGVDGMRRLASVICMGFAILVMLSCIEYAIYAKGDYIACILFAIVIGIFAYLMIVAIIDEIEFKKRLKK